MNDSQKKSDANCPEIETLRKFYLGQLKSESIDVIKLHIDICELCDNKLDLIQQEQFELISQIRESHSPLEPESEQLIELRHKLHHIPDMKEFSEENEELLQEPRSFGNYILLKILGKGGMGTVYLAENKHMKRLTAIKVVHPQLAIHQPMVLQRFQQEIVAVAKLDHPNLIRAYEAGIVDEQPYLAMEYLEGRNLSQLLHDDGILSLKKACEIIQLAAAGINAAHLAGMIHRDIKPSNIILTKEGVVKVLDLGLAFLPASEGLTITGQILGTIQYMAPEQLEDASKVDPRTDIYSLAATLYKLITGTSPLGDLPQHPMKLVADLLNVIPPRVDQLRPEIPTEFSDFLARCLSKNREHRPGSIHKFIEEMNLALHGSKSQSNTPLTSSIISNDGHQQSANTGTFRKYILPASLICLFILLIGVLFQSFGNRDIPPNNGFTVKDNQPLKNENAPLPPPLENKKPVLPQTPSVWDGLTADSIPKELRHKWHPKELVGIIGGEAQHEWGPIKHLTFSHDGEFLAYTVFYTNSVVLKLRSTKDMKELASLTIDDIKPKGKNVNFEIHGLDFLPDGRLLTVQYSGECTVWKFQNGQLNKVKSWLLYHLPVNACTLSPDGTTLATNSGHDNTIHVYNISNTEKPSQKLQADLLKPSQANSIYLKYATDTPHLLATDYKGNVMIWDTSKEIPELLFQQNTGGTWAGISADGKLLAIREYGKNDMHIWSVEEKKEIQNIHEVYTGPESPVFVGKTNPALLTHAGNNGLKLFPSPWKNSNYIELGSLGEVSGRAALKFSASPDGRFISSNSHLGEFIRLWKVSKSGDLATEIGYPSDINKPQRGHRLAFSPDGKNVGIITESNDYHYDHFDIWTIQNKRLDQLSSKRVSWTGNFNVNDETGFSSDSNSDVTTEFLQHLGEKFNRYKKYNHEVLFQSPFNKMCAVISRDKTGNVLTIKPGKSNNKDWLEEDWQAHQTEIHRIQFSPSGKLLASYAADRELKIWDMTVWPPKLLKSYLDEKNTIEVNRRNIHLEFSPDDTHLYFTSSNLWSWKLTEDLPHPTSLNVRLSNQTGDSLAVSPDGRKVMICGFEDSTQSVILWDPQADKLLQSWLLPGQVREAEFAPDGKHVGWLNANGSAYILRLENNN